MTSLLKIERISKIYRNGNGELREALKDASFEIKQGEIFSLLGPNGAGKTTLSSIIASLHPPTSGDILWNDVSIYKNLINYRKIIGFCPQIGGVDNYLNLEEHLVFSGKCYGLSQEQAVERKNILLKDFSLERYAKSYEKELSGGYRQRFLIARSLVHEPDLVILDEPTVGLDPQIRRQLWKIILDLKAQNISILLTTHYLDEAEELSDRVCLIQNGIINTVDTPHNLKQEHHKDSLEEVFLKFMNDPKFI